MQRIVSLAAAALLIGGAASAESDSEKSELPKPDKHHFLIRFSGARLGIEALSISKEVRRMLGAPEDAGVLVNSVEADTAAAHAGIKAGDVIVEVDGNKIDNVSDIRNALEDKKKDDKVKVVVIRDKSRQSLTATVAEQEWSPHAFAKGFAFDDGMFAERFAPNLRKQLEKLNERVAELEKKLQNLKSK